MSETQFTPGPLVVKRAPKSSDTCFMVTTPNGIITTALCYFSRFDEDEPQALADATLYAAAPDLYRALSGLLGAYDAVVAQLRNQPPTDHPGSWRAISVDALAKVAPPNRPTP